MSINGQGRSNDDEKQGGGIDPVRPFFNPIPNIRNQRRLVAGFDDTLVEDANLGLQMYVNLQIHVVDKEVKGSGNQTTKEMTYTN